MKFALLTLLSALSLAAVADWFSIIGVMAIYAAMPVQALIMGIVLAAAKLITTSWVYRNWKFASLRLRLPLIGFVLVLMTITSIGTYGFLSKAHLEQGASTIDNSAKVERLDQQIAREKSVIADDEKVIAQLDGAINSYIDKNRADRSLFVRKQQSPQRQQLRDDIDAAQKRIDGFSNEKLSLQSEVRKQQLDVGPIRYIAELFYGVTEDPTKNIESAVRFFTLLIVLTLDPLAVILLIAANHTLLRIRDEKEKNSSKVSEMVSPPPFTATTETYKETESVGLPLDETRTELQEAVLDEKEKNSVEVAEVPLQITETSEETHTEPNTPTRLDLIKWPELSETVLSEKEYVPEAVTSFTPEIHDIQQEIIEEDVENIPTPSTLGNYFEEDTEIYKAIPEGSIATPAPVTYSLPIIRTPAYTQVDKLIEEIEDDLPIPTNITPEKININTLQDSVLLEIRGNIPHFIPQKVNEIKEENTEDRESDSKGSEHKSETTATEEKKSETIFAERSSESTYETQISNEDIGVHTKSPISHPVRLSWLTEFRRS